MERLNLKKTTDIEIKGQYHIKISKRFSALENMDGNLDINRVSEIKTDLIESDSCLV
jgi:hypothetical protein